jgi:hypothetical protein
MGRTNISDDGWQGSGVRHFTCLQSSEVWRRQQVKSNQKWNTAYTSSERIARIFIFCTNLFNTVLKHMIKRNHQIHSCVFHPIQTALLSMCTKLHCPSMQPQHDCTFEYEVNWRPPRWFFSWGCGITQNMQAVFCKGISKNNVTSTLILSTLLRLQCRHGTWVADGIQQTST